jgi:hypothetical protein
VRVDGIGGIVGTGEGIERVMLMGLFLRGGMLIIWIWRRC